MKSTLFTLNWADFFKGLILAVITPVLVVIQQSLAAGSVTFDWKAIGISALATMVAYLLKNFFTDDVKTAEKIAAKNDLKVVDKSARVLPIILALCMISVGASAQFFSSVPKPKGRVSPNSIMAKSQTQLVADEAAATVKNEFRPLANILSTGYQINHKDPDTDPGVITMYGAGISYQHLVYNSVTEKWNAVWSIGALTYLSTHISGEAMGTNWQGLSFGLWDNKVNFGAATDFKKHMVLNLGVGIPLNNL